MTSHKAESVATLEPRAGIPGPRLPSVNLLSPDTLQHLAVRQVRRRLIAAGMVGALLVGGGWAVQSMRLSSAKSGLAAEQALTPPLRTELASLQPVATFVSGLDSRKQAASKAMAAEVLFSQALKDLNKRTPNGVQLSSISVALTPEVVSAVAPAVSPLTKAGVGTTAQGAPAATTPASSGTAGTGAAPAATDTAGGAGTAAAMDADTPPAPTVIAPSAVSCARPDPFRPASIIGCVTIAGTAPNRAAVGKFIESLKDGKIYADPFVTTTTVSGADGSQQIQFAGSVGLTGTLVSGRYADLSWLSDPKVLAAAEKLVASGSSASGELAKEADARAELKQAQADAAERARKAQEAKDQKAADEAAAKAQQKLLDALKKAETTGEGQ